MPKASRFHPASDSFGFASISPWIRTEIGRQDGHLVGLCVHFSDLTFDGSIMLHPGESSLGIHLVGFPLSEVLLLANVGTRTIAI